MALCIAFKPSCEFAQTELLTREELTSLVVLNTLFAFLLPAEFDVTECTAYAAFDCFIVSNKFFNFPLGAGWVESTLDVPRFE